ncbi:MAG: hypothetical protein KKF46_06930 [Nanoarchaeota archaeon]|nr:hypothetical protein [Nanoarchaeota archaeon]MBU1322062.1 hypothetical protein [Nanoarchaeota archaeon]MBU1597254.1 hypothetical protein [Nanoarchaeota archaeon]MBU2440701.1 hypothetical protein [Nanoarchaeota archaeon]
MERVIEAGAYRYRIDLEKKVLEQPVIAIKLESRMGSMIRMPLPSVKIIEYVPIGVINRYSKPKILDFKTVDELTAKENSLDKKLSEEYEIFEQSFKQKSGMCGLRQQNVIYTQNKYFLLRPKEEACLSHLDLKLEIKYQENEFHSAYLEASINGILAQENSPLARSIVDYWINNNLLIINNAIHGEGADAKFSEGSLKAEAVSEYLERRHGDKIFNSIIGGLSDSIQELFLKEGMKDSFKSFLKQSFPVKVIKEDS